MKNIYLLDVTLRDGGYCNNFNFGTKLSCNVIDNLTKANIDFIEVGYKNGSAKEIRDIGPNGICNYFFLKNLKKENPKASLVVILHAKNCQEIDLLQLVAAGVCFVRFCISSEVTEHEKKLIKFAKEIGLTVSANITRVSEKVIEQIDSIVSDLNNLNVDIIYLADSNGSLTPEKTKKLFIFLSKKTKAATGFHAHNNTGLAMANTIAAIEGGATYIDSSLTGLGKGSGNLSTEEIVAYLYKEKNLKKYNLLTVVEALENFKRNCLVSTGGQSSKGLLMGVYDLSMSEESSIDSVGLMKYFHSYSRVNNVKEGMVA